MRKPDTRRNPYAARQLPGEGEYRGPIRSMQEVADEYNRRNPDDHLTTQQVKEINAAAIHKLRRRITAEGVLRKHGVRT